MAALERPVVKPRPVYLNLLEIRQPLPAIVSILHRVSGALLFLVGIPVLLWGVHASLASPEAYDESQRELLQSTLKRRAELASRIATLEDDWLWTQAEMEKLT